MEKVWLGRSSQRAKKKLHASNGLERAEFAVKSLLFAVAEVAEKFCDLFKGLP